MRSNATTEWRELARKAGNGIEVSLLLNDSGSRLKVAVADERLCHHLDFELDADAVSAFRQPFADATAHLLSRTDEFWGFNQSVRQTASEENS